MVAAAVILNPRRRIVGLDDSKKLTAERRAELAPRIREHALAWAVAEIDSSRIDAWNIYQASRQAMVAAISQLRPLPDYLLLEFMTSRVMAAVAREVIETYGSPDNGWTMDHPVGTGPFASVHAVGSVRSLPSGS